MSQSVRPPIHHIVSDSTTRIGRQSGNIDENTERVTPASSDETGDWLRSHHVTTSSSNAGGDLLAKYNSLSYDSIKRQFDADFPTLENAVDRQPDKPKHVLYLEAQAFCTDRRKRTSLAGEEQFRRWPSVRTAETNEPIVMSAALPKRRRSGGNYAWSSIKLRTS